MREIVLFLSQYLYLFAAGIFIGLSIGSRDLGYMVISAIFFVAYEIRSARKGW